MEIRVSFLDSILYPYNYTTSENQIVVKEISACRYLPDQSALLLVSDDGQLLTASLDVDEHDNLSLAWHTSVEMVIPGYNGSVDAEGCEVPGKILHDGTTNLSMAALISSEHPLALTWFDYETGREEQTGNKNLPSYEIPESIRNNTFDNKGFEALTAWTSPRWNASYILTTTEGSIRGDAAGQHRFLLWDAETGGYPEHELMHEASIWKMGDPRHEYLSIVDFEHWPEQELLLALERGYDGHTNKIRLSSVQLTFPETRVDQTLLDWTLGTLELAPGGSGETTIPLPVDNYEAICFLPHNQTPTSRYLLLVNDNNHNPNQIGTQFVLLKLAIGSKDDAPIMHKEGKPNSATTSGILSGAGVVFFVLALVCFGRLCFRSCQKQRYEKTTVGQQFVSDLELI